jgi:hypothetical protein
VARGAWRVARGAWRVARGAWRVARGAWRVARGAWRVALKSSRRVFRRSDDEHGLDPQKPYFGSNRYDVLREAYP